MALTLNYDDAIPLDAEALAEGGIADAYESLLPKLYVFVRNPANIEEDRNEDRPNYSVRCGTLECQIYSPNLDEREGNSWGRATFALFAMVNEQMSESTHRFYAINGGNDLFGIFLLPSDAAVVKNSILNKRDWPYFPTNESPWYGQYH